MEQIARSRPHGGSTQRNFHSTKYNCADLTKFPNHRYSDRRKFKRNFRSNLNRDKVGEPDCTYTESSSVTHKDCPANDHSETHSQANRRSPNEHSTNISVSLPQHSNGLQGEFPQDIGPPTSEFQKDVSSESVGQCQPNVPETFKPCTDYQPEVSERGNGYKNFQPCNNQERSLTPSPLDLYHDQATDNDDTHRFMNVQETDFPQPSCNEQIYFSQPVGSYQVNNWQPTSDVVYLQDTSHFTPLFRDSNRNHWDRPNYVENGFINPYFERVLKPLPMYADLYYQLPGPLNAAWGMPYYTRGGLFVNPLGMYSCR